MAAIVLQSNSRTKAKEDLAAATHAVEVSKYNASCFYVIIQVGLRDTLHILGFDFLFCLTCMVDHTAFAHDSYASQGLFFS